MTATIVTSDLHLNNLLRDVYRHAWQVELRSFIKKYDANLVIICGDLTHEKNHHSSELVNKVVGHIYRLAQWCDVIILKGNHDYENEDDPFFAFLSRLQGVTWISAPKLLELQGLGRCLFLPSTSDYERDWLPALREECDWIFAHGTFVAYTASGFQLKGVPIGILPRGVTVISGDIHVPQTVGPVTYVGSPYVTDFDVSFEPRVLLIKDDKLKSIPCSGPQKRLLEINSLAELKKRKELQRGDMLKIRVNIAPDKRDAWLEIKQGIVDWAKRQEYDLVTVLPVLPSGDSLKRAAAPKASKRADDDLVQTYAVRQKFDEATLQLGLKINTEVT
jgi:hypothetical protein